MAAENYATKHGMQGLACPLDSRAEALIETHCRNHKPVPRNIGART